MNNERQGELREKQYGHRHPLERLKRLQKKPDPKNEALQHQLKQSLAIVNQLMRTAAQVHVVDSVREILQGRVRR